MTRVDATVDESPSDDEPPSTASVESSPDCWVGSAPRRLTKLACKDEWNDWRWQMRHRIRSLGQLRQYLRDFPPDLFIEDVSKKCPPAFAPMEPAPGRMSVDDVPKKYPLAITPYYLSLIRRPDVSDPVFAMSVPQISELLNPSFLSDDPLEEHQDMPVPGLVHRYPDRALVIVTTTCSSYCRHCTRKRVAGTREVAISPRRLEQVVAYLAAHPEITDVIISGGDPLTLTDEMLDDVLSSIRAVPSVEILRIGTRIPVVMPMRITESLVEILKRHHPLYVNTHFNHPSELTPSARRACTMLVDAGIPMGNQTVLLKGINDSPVVIEQLCRALIRSRVRPYYLFQCDLVRGVEHFRTPLSRGIEIMEYLRGRLSGLAIPSFVVDAPHGGGKIPLLPNYIVSTSPTHTVLRNFEGLLVAYPEPNAQADTPTACSTPQAGGVWELSCGQASAITPGNLHRLARRRADRYQPLFGELSD